MQVSNPRNFTNYKILGISLMSLAMVVGTAKRSDAFAFVSAGQQNGVDVVTHQVSYNGTGGNLIINVGIDPTSQFADEIKSSVLSVINTWNTLVPTTGNLAFGNDNNIPVGLFDFESTLLHEMGHALGLAHINLASESSLGGDEENYTKATQGANGVFNLSAGADNIIGSADDIRGDDVNLNYFRIVDNNPFATNLGVVDSTTYSRDINNLPAGDNYSANGDRDVGDALGFNNTEAVMQQGTSADEAQRELTADDVAGIRYSLTGIDEIGGTADDYTFLLNFAGLTTDADIVIDFDEGQAAFAVTKPTGSFIAGTNDHIAITNAPIFFNPNYDWFFNQETTVEGTTSATFINPVPESPSATYEAVGTNSIEWGVSAPSRSSLSVTGLNFATNLAEPFVAGTITFTNGEIEVNTGISAVDLFLGARFNIPQLGINNFTDDVLRTVNIINTINTDDPIASADSVFIAPPSGLDTMLFGNRFNVQERGTATASLIGRIVDSSINEIPVIELDEDEPNLNIIGDVPVLNQPINRQFSFEILGFGQVLNGPGFITSEPTNIPEPSSIFGLLAFGAIGAGSLMKHKQKKPV